MTFHTISDLHKQIYHLYMLQPVPTFSPIGHHLPTTLPTHLNPYYGLFPLPRAIYPETDHHNLFSGEPSTKKTDSRKTKLPYSPYVAMIGRCILKSVDHQLVLTEIYQSMWDRYPHMRDHMSLSWKMTVRRNLSENDCFVKVNRTGKTRADFKRVARGLLWTIHPACIADFQRGDFDKTRSKLMIGRYNA